MSRSPAIRDDPLVTRRGLIAWVAGGLIAWTALRPVKGLTAAIHAPPTPTVPRFPGERIRVWWPPFLDPSRARVLVLRDGRPAGPAPVHPPARRWWRFLEIEAWPSSPVQPGRYDFVLTVGPVRTALGGFRIAPYRFGC